MFFRIIFTLLLTMPFFVSHAQFMGETSQPNRLNTKLNPAPATSSIMFPDKKTDYYNGYHSNTLSERFIGLTQENEEKNAMEKWGRILVYVGAPLLLGGIILAATSDSLFVNCNSVNGCDGDWKGGLGMTMISLGLPLAIGGTVLWIIGSKKRKKG